MSVVKIDIGAAAKKINAAFANAVVSFIETGRLLWSYNPKSASPSSFPYGSFQTMIETKLDFSPRTARRLMQIASHPILSKRTHESVLPPSLVTLALLASPKITEAKLTKAIKDGTVNPDMERKDVAKLMPKSRGSSKNNSSNNKSEEEEYEPDLTAEQQWQQSLSNMAGDAISARAYWKRLFGDWEKFKVTSELVTLAKQAAMEWEQLATDLAKQKGK